MPEQSARCMVRRTHRNGVGEVGHLAPDGRRAAAAQVGRQTHASGGAAVELALQVLQVEGEIEDIRISNLHGRQGQVTAALCSTDGSESTAISVSSVTVW